MYAHCRVSMSRKCCGSNIYKVEDLNVHTDMNVKTRKCLIQSTVHIDI